MRKHKKIAKYVSKRKPHIVLGLVFVLILVAYAAVNIAKPQNVEAQTPKPVVSAKKSTNTSTQTATPAPTVTSTTPTTSATLRPSNTQTATKSGSSNTVTPSSSLPFASSLVGYWKLNGNATSALGKDDGSTVGNVGYVSGKFGMAAHFDGHSYIEIADKDYFSPATTGGKMTVSFWFKPDTYNFTGINEGYVNFLGKTNGPGADEWLFRVDNETAYDGFSRSERMNFYGYSPSGGLGTGSAINKACPLSAWTHVIGETDGVSTKLYINGRLVDSDLLSDYNIHFGNTSAPLRFGTSDKESFFQGSLSNVMIFNRALSDAEAAQLYSIDLSK